MLGRRGLLILVSDLYDDEEAVEAELRRAVRMGHEVAVFHVLTRDELEFPFGAEVELEDLESGRRVAERRRRGSAVSPRVCRVPRALACPLRA